MVVFPAPDGPTIAVRVPAGAEKEIPRSTSPLSIVSGRDADSSEASEMSCALGYEKATSLNAMARFLRSKVVAPGLSVIIGWRSRTSKTRSKETSEVITSIRTLDNAVNGP